MEPERSMFSGRPPVRVCVCTYTGNLFSFDAQAESFSDRHATDF